MNNCLDIKYKSLYSTENDLRHAVKSVLSQIQDDWTCVHLIFFIQATTDAKYFESKEIIDSEAFLHFSEDCPAITMVAQASLKGTLQAEVQHFNGQDIASSLKYKRLGTHPYVTLETEEYKFLYTGALQSCAAGNPPHAKLRRHSTNCWLY